jgi:hypothetical protein
VEDDAASDSGSAFGAYEGNKYAHVPTSQPEFMCLAYYNNCPCFAHVVRLSSILLPVSTLHVEHGYPLDLTSSCGTTVAMCVNVESLTVSGHPRYGTPERSPQPEMIADTTDGVDDTEDEDYGKTQRAWRASVMQLWHQIAENKNANLFRHPVDPKKVEGCV